MKKKDLQDLKNKTVSELEKLVEEKTREVARLRSEIALSRQKNVRSAKIARTTLARAKTIIALKAKEEKV